MGEMGVLEARISLKSSIKLESCSLRAAHEPIRGPRQIQMQACA